MRPPSAAVWERAPCAVKSQPSIRRTPFLLWKSAHIILWPCQQRVGARHFLPKMHFACDPTFRSSAAGVIVRLCSWRDGQLGSWWSSTRPWTEMSPHKRRTTGARRHTLQKVAYTPHFFEVLTFWHAWAKKPRTVWLSSGRTENGLLINVSTVPPVDWPTLPPPLQEISSDPTTLHSNEMPTLFVWKPQAWATTDPTKNTKKALFDETI